MSSISVSERQPLQQIGVKPVLVDVRTPAEFEEVHAAVNLPLDPLSAEALRAAVAPWNRGTKP